MRKCINKSKIKVKAPTYFEELFFTCLAWLSVIGAGSLAMSGTVIFWNGNFTSSELYCYNLKLAITSKEVVSGGCFRSIQSILISHTTLFEKIMEI